MDAQIELIEQSHSELSFIGSLNRNIKIEAAAERIRKTLKLSENWASKQTTWEDALNILRQTAEDAEILVASSSYVGSYTNRPLVPQEFRGFVLCDTYAPLILLIVQILSQLRCSLWPMN